MGLLVERAQRLPTIDDPDEWERSVEALLLAMAIEVEGGVLRHVDYTRKTQQLAETRRLLTGEPH